MERDIKESLRRRRAGTIKVLFDYCSAAINAPTESLARNEGHVHRRCLAIPLFSATAIAERTLTAEVSKPLERHINNGMQEAERGQVTLREVEL